MESLRSRSREISRPVVEETDVGHDVGTATREYQEDGARTEWGIEAARLDIFETKYDDFFQNYGEMADEDFHQKYQEALAELNAIIDRVEKGQESPEDERPFVAIQEINDFSDFLDRMPMYFIPRKEEIGRILTIAIKMHESQIEHGQKKNGDPIRILDIGGANGALGKLIVDLAKENGLNMEYTITDPDAALVAKAAQYYQQDTSFRFSPQAGEEFNLEQYRDRPDLLELFHQRTALIAEGERQREALKKFCESIYAENVSQRLWVILALKAEIGIDIPIVTAKTAEAFRAVFNNQPDPTTGEYRSFVDRQMDGWRNQIEALTREIEDRIATEPPHYDLVINSWMPPRKDFTKDVREANGAALLYAVERWGATGCRSDAEYPEKPSGLREEESYNPGSLYQSRVGWISHSSCQAKDMMHKWAQPDRFWEHKDQRTEPYANGFIVQTRNEYKGTSMDIYDLRNVTVRGRYPWERELTQRGGPTSPIDELRDKRDGTLDFYPVFQEMADELERREKAKLEARSE